MSMLIASKIFLTAKLCFGYKETHFKVKLSHEETKLLESIMRKESLVSLILTENIEERIEGSSESVT